MSMKLNWMGRAALPLLLAVAGCAKGESFAPEAPGSSYDAVAGDYGESADGPSVPNGEGQGNPGATSGVLTAAEWNDLAHWDFWTKLLRNQEWNQAFSMWRFNTTARVAVRVKDAGGNPAVNVPVALHRSQNLVWEARTDNTGEANLWVDLFGEEGFEVPVNDLSVSISGQVQAEAPGLCSPQGVSWNEYTVSASQCENKADIAFIVDATGSMSDEIDFLKEDLLSILETVQQHQQGTEIRTGAVFYRDRGDDYITRSNPFTTNAVKTMSFVKKQEAEGGGDLPEAVHSALECGLQELEWNTAARARIAFLILDAPAHYNEQGVLESLHKSISLYAKSGIRMIPVLASTGDKSTEFMCRYFAMTTNGTYVFLTDDSGVGNSHLEPSVGEYQVEKLNDLLVRLIEAYIK